MRCFICIDFDDPVVKEIARIQEVLENKKFNGKMTELENLHLTLKFIGEVDDKKVEEIRKRLREIKFKEMELKLGEIGTFSYMGMPKIVWVKVNGEDIWVLQKYIDDKLKDLFKDGEKFMSHLTIARIKYVNGKKEFREYISNMGIKEIKFKVNSFKLKKSDLKPLGPVYETIEEFKL